MDDLEIIPSKRTDTTLPARCSVLYTTVYKNGKAELVPYHPGAFEPLRAFEFMLSGASVAMAANALQTGRPLAAAVLGLMGLLEFFIGMRRWADDQSRVLK